MRVEELAGAQTPGRAAHVLRMVEPPVAPLERRRRRRRRLVALVVIVALIAGLGVAGAVAGVLVRNQADQLQSAILLHLEKGQGELDAAKTSLKQANSAHDPKLLDQAKAHFVSAGQQFQLARSTTDGSRLLSTLERAPVLGDSVKTRQVAVDAVSEMGIDLSRAGQTLSDLDALLISPAGSGQQGKTLLTVISEVGGKIGPVRDQLKAALAAWDRVDLAVLPASQQSTFQHARGTISLALAAIDQFQGLVPIMTEVLGGNGSRTYLIEQVNPSELRPGGGFIGTYSILRADHGTLELLRSGNAADVSLPRANLGQAGYIAPPGPIRELIPLTSWSFIDSNFFADFPTNASWGETFVQQRLGMHIDGVIAIDYYTVAAMLAITGPIAVPGSKITLTADNFIPTVVQYDFSSITDPAAEAIHKAILEAAAGPLLQRIVALPANQWPNLLGSLNGLAGSRHLQTFFNNGDVENTIGQYGWSGGLQTKKSGDYMMEVEANLGGTKANYFVSRHYTVVLSRIGDYLHHEVTVDVRDDMPYSYRPNEYYRAYMRMFISDKTFNKAVDLARPKYGSPDPPAGTQQLDGWIQIHGYGHDRAVTFYWDTPWTSKGRWGGYSEIYWQKQPGTSADKVDVVWNDADGHTYTTTGDLAQDRVIALTPTGVFLLPGQVGTAQLPSLSLG